MKNRRALFSAITSLTVLTLTIFACGDDDNSTFDKNNGNDAANFDTGSGFNVDGKSQEKDADVSCTPQLPTTFTQPTMKAATQQKVCDQTELVDYYKHCIAADAQNNAKLKTTECSDWLAAHADCAKCVEAPDGSGPVQIWRDRFYYTYNSAGCVGILQKNTAKDSCADLIWAVDECRRVSCDQCFDKQGIQGDDFNNCRTNATTDCATYKTKRDNTCAATGYLDAGSSLTAVSCFPVNDGSPLLCPDAPKDKACDAYLRLAKVYCLK